jgi:hypothetical protein
VSLPRRPLDAALEDDVPPSVPAPGPRSTTWSAIAIASGLCSTTRTVLPLSRSRTSSSFIRSMSCGVQADRRLVEDVGHVGERGAEVADHLDPLRLTARQGARRPVEREVAQPDLHERVERVVQRLSSGATDGASRSPTHAASSLTCIAQASAMLIPSIFRRQGPCSAVCRRTRGRSRT